MLRSSAQGMLEQRGAWADPRLAHGHPVQCLRGVGATARPLGGSPHLVPFNNFKSQTVERTRNASLAVKNAPDGHTRKHPKTSDGTRNALKQSISAPE